MNSIITISEFIANDMPQTPWLMNPMIPVSGIVLLHGMAGLGKTALAFNMATAIHTGSDFLGHSTVGTNVLYVNLDMPVIGLHNRLKNANFQSPVFLINTQPIDVVAGSFPASRVYYEIKHAVNELNIGLVIFDALGRLVSNSVLGDDTARKVYATIQEWLGDRCVLLLHHDRKRRWSESLGSYSGPSEEDAAGSQYWRNHATVVLHLYRINALVRELKITKSQVGLEDEAVDIYLDEGGMKIELWEAHKLLDIREKVDKIDKLLKEAGTMTKIQREEFCQNELGIGYRTVQRWRQLSAGGS